MDVICGYSSDTNAEIAVRNATSSIKNPKMILFFGLFDMFEELTAEMAKRFPNCEIIGASTSVAFQNDMNWDANREGKGISVTAFGDDFECTAGILEDVRQLTYDDCDHIRATYDRLGKPENTVCFEIMNFSETEEDPLELLNEALKDTGVYVVGGCAGMIGGNEPKTLLSYNGVVYDKACVYCFIHNKRGGYRIINGDILKPTRRTFIPTDVDVLDRIVYEFDGIPAAKALADALNISVQELAKEIAFHPIGRVDDGVLNIVQINEITPELGVKVLAAVYGFVEMVLLENDDYEKRMAELWSRIKTEAPKAGFAMMVMCDTITKYLKYENWLEIMGKGFDEVLPKYVGYSGTGEQRGHFHMNQSIIVLIFEDEGPDV